MKVCASLSSVSDIDLIGKADMAEIRLDLLNSVPNIPGKDLIVTFRGTPDLSVLPKGYKGMIDIGENDLPDTDLEIVSSHHDYDRTPSSAEILSILSDMKGDVVKGAFQVNSFLDLKNIHDASETIGRRHVLLGMGESGAVTRIRQDILANEFTFAYVKKPTAPGQLGLDDMLYLGSDPMIVGIVGDPLEKTLSPAMHNAVMKKLNIKGIYLKFNVKELTHIEDAIRDYNIRGLNITIPYKTSIIDHLDTVSAEAEEIGAVNTVVNDDNVLKGYNTDIIGIENALHLADFDPSDRRALIMGSGGAARACAYILRERGCRVTVIGRNPESVRSLCKDLGCEMRSPDSVSLPAHELIVNCTPVGMYGDGEYPINICQLTKHHTVFDMVYGAETELLKKARAVSAGIVSGEDMLALQGTASLELWTGRKNLFGDMRETLF